MVHIENMVYSRQVAALRFKCVHALRARAYNIAAFFVVVFLSRCSRVPLF